MLDGIFSAGWVRVAMFLIIVTAVIAPSSLAICVFAPTTFAAVDFGKLLLLSIAVGLPLAIFNGYVLIRAGERMFINDSQQSAEKKSAIFIGFVSAMTIFPIYVPIFWHAFTGLGGIRTAIILVMITASLQATFVGSIVWWYSPCPSEGNYDADFQRASMFFVPWVYLIASIHWLREAIRALCFKVCPRVQKAETSNVTPESISKPQSP